MATLPVVTVPDAIAAVKGALDLIDDGVSDPILDAKILSDLNRAQRQLIETQALAPIRRQGRVDSVAGVRLLDLPADCRYGQIKQVLHVSAAGTRTELLPGLDRTRDDPAGIPQRYDLVPDSGIVAVSVTTAGTGATDGDAVAVSGGTRSADGTDPILTLIAPAGIVTGVRVVQNGAGWSVAPTLTPGSGTSVLAAALGATLVLEIQPKPADGYLLLDYDAGVYPLEDEADVLSVDDVAVVGLAAWMTSITRKPSASPALLAAHNVYISALAGNQRPGQVFSMRRAMPADRVADPYRRYRVTW